ncbi:biotin/lipoyl-containing protein, partial [Mycolicibacterium sp.]|uniref:biotin/lipoyl-containing protein n=1 Tax=Mycolicibacterium sp. TaxID=2320850 RepID=UPI003D0A8150
MPTREFRLPDVGEGLTEAEILTWHVAVGDEVEVNQLLVEIETAKSLVELPSPYAGTVQALLADEGQTVAVGTPLIGIETATAAAGSVEASAAEDEPKLLVGYGARTEPQRTRRRRSPASPVSGRAPSMPAAPAKPRAKPPVRKLARVLGVDLAAVTSTGPDGTVVRTDVLAAADTPPPAPATAFSGTRVPVKGVRKHMAAAMVASAFTAPHVT